MWSLHWRSQSRVSDLSDEKNNNMRNVGGIQGELSSVSDTATADFWPVYNSKFAAIQNVHCTSVDYELLARWKLTVIYRDIILLCSQYVSSLHRLLNNNKNNYLLSELTCCCRRCWFLALSIRAEFQTHSYTTLALWTLKSIYTAEVTDDRM